MKVGIVILAAGASARMGQPKQLLACRGSTLLGCAIQAALLLPASAVVVVLGANAATIRAQLDDPRVLLAENPDWRSGMGGTLRTGLRALLAAHPETSAAIFLVCDQPMLSADMLRKLVAAHRDSGAPIVAAEYDGTRGVPALFASALFPDLLALSGAEGARQIIEKYRSQAVGIPFPEATIDIDTPADYQRLLGLSQEAIVPRAAQSPNSTFQ